MRLDNASENDILVSRPKGEQREAGEARKDLDRVLRLAADLKDEDFLGDMVAEWGDLADGT